MVETVEDWEAKCRAKVGGQTDLIKDLATCIHRHFKHQERRRTHGLPNVLGLLLEGHSGVGKGYLGLTLAESSGLPWKIIRIEELFLSSAADIAPRIVSSFDENVNIYVMENVELLTGRLGKGSMDYDRSLHAAFSAVFERLACSPTAKVIIGTTSSLELIDEVWLRGCRFSKVHHVTVSKPEQRREILGILLKDSCAEPVVEAVVMQTHGFTVADLVALKTAAIMKAVLEEADSKRIEERGELLLEDFQSALKTVRPSLMANYYQPPPKQRMGELVGLDPIIQRLRELILTPLQSPELCRKYRLGLPKGILVHGPPGTGKTHLVMGLVREAGLNYIPVRACSIRSKYVGQSEKNLAAVFQKARECAPSILVLDQLDGLVTRRSAEASTSDNSANRLITCFLTEMDGLFTKDKENGVIVIGITDSIGSLDEAMIRPGRLGIHLELPSELPLADRQAFFSKTRIRHGLSEAQVFEIAQKTEGYTGAKLDWLLREAAMKALDEGIVHLHHFDTLLNSSVQ